jgi:alpha-glucosidase (family GH31 glycosyl hydrolase)
MHSFILGPARFTCLSPSLVRLEYATSPVKDGALDAYCFEDRKTVQAYTRSSGIPWVAVEATTEKVVLSTGVLTLTYTPNGHPFSPDNLHIAWEKGKRQGTWSPGQVDLENLGGTVTSLDMAQRHFLPEGVHPAGVGLDYPGAQTVLYAPTTAIHQKLRAQGEKTEFEKPPLWYLWQHRQEEWPETVKQTLREWQKCPPGILSAAGYFVLDDSQSALVDDQGALVEDLQRAGQDWYFFAYGHDYALALQDFVNLCGAVPMVPSWTFGVWFSVFGPLAAQDYQDLVDHFEGLDLPLDVLVIDVDWHDHGWCGWDWQKERFPDPKAFLHWVKAQGLHLTANVHIEGLPPTDSHFEGACSALGLDPNAVRAGEVFPVKNPTMNWIFDSWQADGGGVFIPTPEEQEVGWLLFNLAKSKEAHVFWDHLHRPLVEQGIDFWWIDGANAHAAGVHSQLWTNHVYYTHQQAQTQRRSLILSRTGGIGSHRYPVQFSADTFSHWEVLQFQVDYTARSGNVGVAYQSHDIGGFFGPQAGVGPIDPELFLRWVQFGALSPVFRLHSDHGQREPWAYGEKILRAVRQVLHLRARLLPYFYHLSWVCHQRGLPLCRPLYLHYPEDPKAYERSGTYLLGPDMLVAPVVEPGEDRQVYVPEGTWMRWQDGSYHAGPARLDLWVPLEEIPLFIRVGALIPMKNSQNASHHRSSPKPASVGVEFHCFGGTDQAEGFLDFYTDDEESLEGKDGRKIITVRFSHQQGVWHLWTASTEAFVLHSPNAPKQVFKNGELVLGTAWQAI